MNCPYYIYNVYCPFRAERYHSNHRLAINKNVKSADPLSVSSTPMSKDTDEIREYLQIPNFTGEVNPRILSHINENIKNDIMEFKSQMEDAASDSAKEMKNQGKHFIPYEISNSYLVTYNKDNILSVSLIYHEYINGRSSYVRTSYNYNLETGESMPLRSLFKPGVNYIDILNRKVRATLQKNSQLYPPDALQRFKGIAEDHPYYLDNNNLNLFFGFNEIAPLSGEIPVIKIPLSELSGIINPQFLRTEFSS